jgi:hypothetical protein
MLSAIPTDAIASNAVQVSPEGASATDFIGKRAETSGHPLAFLVQGPPGYVIPPHFHEVDQYQIFVGGSAVLGRHAVQAGSIHYADTYTPYGPIAATDEGFTYLTLIKPVNEARGRRGRMMVADVAGGAGPGMARLFEEPDGVAAYRLCAAAGGALPAPDVAHGGAYFVVLEGEAEAGGKVYPPRSCIWVDREEAAPAITAGAEGAVVAFMAFARRTA